MSKFCAISGKRPLVGNTVSKSHIKTKRRQLPNLQLKNIYVPELGRSIKIKVSIAALKNIDKIGLMKYLKKQDLQLSDII